MIAETKLTSGWDRALFGLAGAPLSPDVVAGGVGPRGAPRLVLREVRDVPRARGVSRVARREGEHARPAGGAAAGRDAGGCESGRSATHSG